MKTTKLYRPVGVTELLLIQELNFTAFPPRLEWQPIFYPVLNQLYAETIALDWNTVDRFSGYAGFVLAFDVDSIYLKKFKVENVGGHNHNELWVPSDELEVFNQNIKNKIEIKNAFFGVNFKAEEYVLLQELAKKFRK